jgi:DNA polymerase-3 subunit delta
LLYLLFGADDFSLRDRLGELKRGWGDEESLSINTTLFEARQLTLSQLINACDAVPFLGANRLVIVEGLLSRFEPKAAGRYPEIGEWGTLGDYAPKLPPTTQLLLIDGKITKTNPLLRRLAPVSKVQEFPLLKGAKLQQWVRSQVAQSGGSISPRAMKLLTELAGENLWTLTNEIEKLSLYAKGRRIEEEDVQQVTAYAREANIFAMVDAVVERRVPTAMRLLHQLLAEGMAPPHLLFMLTRQLRLLVQAKELSAQKLSLMEKQEQLGLSPSYPIDRLLKQCATYPMPRLVEVYQKLLETDLAIKTGKWKDELALDLLLAEVGG